MTAAAARLCGIGDEGAPELADQIRLHAALGVRALELRTVGGRWLHELDAAGMAAVAAEVAAAGLVVPVVDTPIGGWSVTVADDFDAELRLLEKYAARAGAVGCRRLRVMSYPGDGRPEPAWRDEALRRMAELARRAADLGVTLLHENCHGWASRSAAATVHMLEHVDSPALRLVFDTGNGLAYGYEAAPFLSQVLPYVEHVHVKDGVRGTNGEAEFGLPGDGDAGLVTCLRLLGAAGYSGWYSLEPHVLHAPHLGRTDQPDRLMVGYRRCMERLRGLLAELDAKVSAEASDG